MLTARTSWKYSQANGEVGIVGCCRKIASLTMSAVSSTFRAHFSEHSEKSAISLSFDGFASSNPGSLVISQVGNSVRPMASLRSATADHDYYFELLREEERDAQSICSMFYCTPWRFPSCPACEPNFRTC